MIKSGQITFFIVKIPEACIESNGAILQDAGDGSMLKEIRLIMKFMMYIKLMIKLALKNNANK